MRALCSIGKGKSTPRVGQVILGMKGCDRNMSCSCTAPETVEEATQAVTVPEFLPRMGRRALWGPREWLDMSQAGGTQDTQARQAESICFH